MRINWMRLKSTSYWRFRDEIVIMIREISRHFRFGKNLTNFFHLNSMNGFTVRYCVVKIFWFWNCFHCPTSVKKLYSNCKFCEQIDEIFVFSNGKAFYGRLNIGFSSIDKRLWNYWNILRMECGSVSGTIVVAKAKQPQRTE